MNTTSWGDLKRQDERDIIRQRIRLAVVNMAVLAIIWVALAGFVYSMEHRQTIRTVDQELQRLAAPLARGPGGCRAVPQLDRGGAAAGDIHYLTWGPEDRPAPAVYQPFPADSLPYLQQLLSIHRATGTVYYSANIQGVPYRIRQWRVNSRCSAQLFENVQDDQSRLARLLALLAWGGGIGLILSVVGGFLMGLWTLRPILAVRRREQEFLSDISHELRTPLTVVTTDAELLLRYSSDRVEEHLPWVEAIYSEGQRMARMVGELLEMGRLEEGARALNLERISLTNLCETAAAIYQPVLEESGLTLSLDIAQEGAVMGDALRLRQLLLIFLDNARQHTSRGGVTLKVAIRGRWAEIHVEDTGEGMPRDFLQRAGRRFEQARGRPQEATSRGLGLAIAQKIVEAHHGKLEFHSIAGIGTDVVVSLRFDRRP